MRPLEIMIGGKRFFLILFLIFLTGCVSDYKNFKLSNLDDNEATVIGKIEIVYDNHQSTESCRFCIDSTCQDLTREGYFFMSMGMGAPEQLWVKCDRRIDFDKRSYFSFKIEPFEVFSGVNYFGDFIFNVEKVSYLKPVYCFNENHNRGPKIPHGPQVVEDTSLDWIGMLIDMLLDQQPEEYIPAEPTDFGIAFFGSMLISDDSPDDCPKARMERYFAVSVSEQDNMQAVLDVFRKQVGDEKIQAEYNPMKIGVQLEQRGPYQASYEEQ